MVGRRACGANGRPRAASPVSGRRLLDRDLPGPGFRYVGVGVVNADGAPAPKVFMEPASQPAPSTSASAAGAPFSMPWVVRPVSASTGRSPGTP
jgi:hypothetical protein